MPSAYTGNPVAAQSPSPAPSLSDDPVGNMPNDGDASNVSSILQALKVPLDWIAFLRRQVLASGVTLWNSANTYSALTMVLSPGDGNTYRVKAGHISSVGVDPASPGGATDWEQWALTSEQVDDMLPAISVSTDTAGIAVAIVGTVGSVSDVVFTTVGYATYSKRGTFKLNMGSGGIAATITFSGTKAFSSGIKTVQVTWATNGAGMFHGSAVISSPNVIVVTTDLGGADLFVTVEGY